MRKRAGAPADVDATADREPDGAQEPMKQTAKLTDEGVELLDEVILSRACRRRRTTSVGSDRGVST